MYLANEKEKMQTLNVRRSITTREEEEGTPNKKKRRKDEKEIKTLKERKNNERKDNKVSKIPPSFKFTILGQPRNFRFSMCRRNYSLRENTLSKPTHVAQYF